MKTRLLLALASVVISTSFALAKEKPVLEKGMPAAMIIQLVGKPDEISPLKSSEGQAETWIYRRKIGQTVHQTANTQKTIPAMTGFTASGPTIGQAIVPDYRLKYVRAYQVTALLMLDGRLQLGRQWVSRDEQFAD